MVGKYSVDEIISYLKNGTTDENETETNTDNSNPLAAIFAARYNKNGYGAVRYRRRALFKKCCGKRVLIFSGVGHGVKAAFYMTFYACTQCGRVECRTSSGLRYVHDIKITPSRDKKRSGNVIYFSGKRKKLQHKNV